MSGSAVWAGRRPPWGVLRLAGGGLILAVVLWRLGTGPVLAGLGRISVGVVTAAVAITLITTVASAWRWTVVATTLGVPLTLRAAVLAYYRSQFLNTTLPGGILGDVHRAVDHGHRTGELGRAARAVVWERAVGQVVQAGLTIVVLFGLGWPSRPALVVGVVVAVGVFGLIGLLTRRRWRQAAYRDVRTALLSRPAWPRIGLASVVVVAGHTGVLFLAARTAGVTVSNSRLLALCLLVLLATSVPLNVAGWGPREGAAAWLFGLAGVGAAGGLSTATIDGVLVFVACLPGVLVLLAGWAGHHGEPGASEERDFPVLMASGSHG